MDYIKRSVDNQTSSRLEVLNLQGRSKEKLLLHCCCAPCATYVIDYLISSYDITLFFYNPNIDPYAEYQKRKAELEKLSVMYSLHYGVQLAILDSIYDNDNFIDTVNPFCDEPEGGKRCKACFDVRLGETARQAKANGFDIFATTLSVSPHKNAAILNDCGIRQSNEHNIKYLVADFKKKNGYKQSIELTKKYGLYRQSYCGCIYSLTERLNYLTKKEARI